jgi:hypothetical protein
MSRSIFEYIKQGIVAGGDDYFYKEWDFLSDEELTEFTATAIAGGSGAVVDTVHGGVLSLTAAATTDNSGANLQADASYLTLGLGREVIFWARAALHESTSTNAATESDIFLGLFVKADTDLTGAVVDGVYFRKDDGDTNIDVSIHGASAASGSDNVATMVSGDVYKDFLIHVVMDPTVAAKGTATFYIDGTAVAANVPSGAFPLVSVILSPGAEFNTGDNTGTKALYIDFIRLLATR